MPWSWIRVSRSTSPKLHECKGDDTSAQAFAACVHRISEADGATSVDVKFEASGRHALVSFYWSDPQVKNAVVFDLGGEQVFDLLDTEEMQKLASRNSGAT